MHFIIKLFGAQRVDRAFCRSQCDQHDGDKADQDADPCATDDFFVEEHAGADGREHDRATVDQRKEHDARQRSHEQQIKAVGEHHAKRKQDGRQQKMPVIPQAVCIGLSGAEGSSQLAEQREYKHG